MRLCLVQTSNDTDEEGGSRSRRLRRWPGLCASVLLGVPSNTANSYVSNRLSPAGAHRTGTSCDISVSPCAHYNVATTMAAVSLTFS